MILYIVIIITVVHVAYVATNVHIEHSNNVLDYDTHTLEYYSGLKNASFKHSSIHLPPIETPLISRQHIKLDETHVDCEFYTRVAPSQPHDYHCLLHDVQWINNEFVVYTKTSSTNSDFTVKLPFKIRRRQQQQYECTDIIEGWSFFLPFTNSAFREIHDHIAVIFHSLDKLGYYNERTKTLDRNIAHIYTSWSYNNNSSIGDMFRSLATELSSFELVTEWFRKLKPRSCFRGLVLGTPLHTTIYYPQHVDGVKKWKRFNEWLDHNVNRPPASPPSMITIIERTNTHKRYIKNLDEILNVLKASPIGSNDVQTIILEELTFKQQLQVLQNTRVLIGVEGAGLINSLFLPKRNSGGIIIWVDKQIEQHRHNYYHIFEQFFRMRGGQTRVFLAKGSWKQMYIDPHRLLETINELLLSTTSTMMPTKDEL